MLKRDKIWFLQIKGVGKSTGPLLALAALLILTGLAPVNTSAPSLTAMISNNKTEVIDGGGSDYKFLVLGDSFIAENSAVGEPLERELLKYENASVKRLGKVSSGLIDTDFFDWYKTDFTQRHHSLKAFFSEYAHLFSHQAVDVNQIREMNVNITFLKYDWDLNDFKK